MAARCSPVFVGVAACTFGLVGLVGLGGPAACARSSLAEEAYEAPVDPRAPTSVKDNGDDAGSDGGDDDPAEPGLVARDDFSRQTETVCAVAGCSFSDKVDIERVFEDARVSAGAEQDDALAREALAEAFGGPRFTSTDALRYYELEDPPNDDIVAQLSRVLADLHAILDASQREAIATEIAEVGPFAVLGVPRRGGFGAGQRRGPRVGDDDDDDTADDDPSHDNGGRERGGKGGKRGHQRGSGSGRPGNVGADGLRVRQRARVDGLCEALECSDGQRSQLTSMFSQREREDFDAEIASMNLKLALLFRADEAPSEAVERQMRSLREMGDARDRMRAELLAGIHELLTPQQRAAAATRMRSEDPGRALGLRRGS